MYDDCVNNPVDTWYVFSFARFSRIDGRSYASFLFVNKYYAIRQLHQPRYVLRHYRVLSFVCQQTQDLVFRHFPSYLSLPAVATAPNLRHLENDRINERKSTS